MGPSSGQNGPFPAVCLRHGGRQGPRRSLTPQPSVLWRMFSECANTGWAPCYGAGTGGCLSQDHCVSPNAGHDCGSHEHTKWGLACRRPAAAAFPSPSLPACPGRASGHCWHPPSPRRCFPPFFCGLQRGTPVGICTFEAYTCPWARLGSGGLG